ncbi:FAD-binding protein [Timonella senegalensis]|uniref:FAD-binding protein n=1 Tax=Timonella senegalensis TaxID=1465825 RepID=UPI002FDE7605
MEAQVFDVVVIGSGAAALTAAVTAADAGKKVLVAESTELFGGSTAMSGGGAWIPNNHLMKAGGTPDSFEDARTYMDRVIADVGPASSKERRDAFVRSGPEMVRFLETCGFEWIYGVGYADYHPEEPGGSVRGRGIEGKMFNFKALDPELRKQIRPGVPIPMYTFEVGTFMRAFRSMKGLGKAAQIIGLRALGGRVAGKHWYTNGQSMIGQLLHLASKRGVTLWTQSALIDLVTEDGDVTGAVLDRAGVQTTVMATNGVIIGAGGFAHNQEMREKYLPQPTNEQWSSANPGDQGLPIKVAMEAGASIAIMEEAWWGPSSFDPATGKPSFLVSERSFPHSMIVDEAGKRFMNESASYVDCGHWQYAHNESVPAVPAWMIMESRHRNSYPFGFAMPRQTPKKMFESGFFYKGDTLEELARKIGVDAQGLVAEAAKFSGYAATGKDLDFGRGDSAYDHVYGDPRVKPNPNLGAIERGPFYATRIYPGDLGTKGGILTDEHARALREDGTVIKGLYAAGNSSASVMGNRYPGPGSTIGPAMTFGYIAARHAVGVN